MDHFVHKWKFLIDAVFIKVFQKTVHHNCFMGLVVTYAHIRFMGKFTTSIYVIITNGCIVACELLHGILGQQPGLRRKGSLQKLAQ